MLVLFETPAGFALFKVNDDSKLKSIDNLHKEFASASKAQNIVSLQGFHKFFDTTEALAASTSISEGKMDKSLKTFLKSALKKSPNDQLGVIDSKLAKSIKEKLGTDVTSEAVVQELSRGIRSQLSNLLTEVPDKDLSHMVLGLSHSLSRYKIKFSPDKVDTMIVQAIGLLDDLDKELNTYAMRVKEWYGWHFPELFKIVPDNILYAKTARTIGVRHHPLPDLTEVLPEELEDQVKEAAKISMGTEISEEDMLNIGDLCVQVMEMAEYRDQLFEYLKHRMQAIAPNLTVLVGELVGARLIAHAGSLLNLAKHPASTVQILGAEKALFRALKTKHATPKYGLIYHASLVGQASQKNKGKMSRVLANKCALSIRVDALGDQDTAMIGPDSRNTVENRLRQLEGREIISYNTTSVNTKKYDSQRDAENPSLLKDPKVYDLGADTSLPTKMEVEDDSDEEPKKKSKKRKRSTAEEEEEEPKKKKSKKDKKDKKEKKDEGDKKDKKEKKEKKENKAARTRFRIAVVTVIAANRFHKLGTKRFIGR